MTLEETVSKMNQMKFHAMARSVRERLGDPQQQDLSHEEFVALLIDDEWLDRENKKLKRRLHQAKFKVVASPDQIDYTLKRGLVKPKMMELFTLKWILARQNILLIGPTGVGKSFIAQALGHQACQKGYSVHYLRLSLLLNQLFLGRAQGTLGKMLERLSRYDVLILDDWGIAPLKNQESQDLLEIIEDRHEVKSTIITSQLPVKHWHEFIGNDTIADAICDRLVHGSHQIEIKGESVRRLKNGSRESMENNDPEATQPQDWSQNEKREKKA